MKARLTCVALGLGGLALGTMLSFFFLRFVFMAIYAFADFDVPKMFELPASIALPWLALAGGLLSGWGLSRWYARRRGIVWKRGPLFRIAAWLVVALYFLTWALGAPMVQSENTRWALSEWKRVDKKPKDQFFRGNYPRIQTYATLPLLPFVVASYHEYQLAPLYGAGGWDIQFWYVAGVKRIWFVVSWVS